MKKIPSFALIAGLIFPPIPSVVNAQNECSWGTNSQQRVFAHEAASITVSTTALGLTAATYDQSAAGGPKATQALVSIETNSVRVTVDGTAPTSAVGLLVTAGSTFVVCGNNIALLRAIRVSADAGMQATYSTAQ